MKATAVAPSNIAFIKYWGKENSDFRLPLNSSFSMNLSETYTTTTVEFSPSYKNDDVVFVGGEFSVRETERVTDALGKMREKTRTHSYARVKTKNTFPKGTGIAASASGFAALTVAGFAALGFSLSEKDLTIFARLCSGSACRSIPDGFVLWEKGDSSETSYARSLYPHTYWDLSDVLVIVDAKMKKVPTTEGQMRVQTSPFWKQRMQKIPERMKKVQTAFEEKNFSLLGETIEEECLSMHEVMQTQVPPLFYWNDLTRKLMKLIQTWRSEGLPVYFTIDAGPNVHCIVEKKHVALLQEKLQTVSGIHAVIVNSAAPGAHVIPQHLW